MPCMLGSNLCQAKLIAEDEVGNVQVWEGALVWP